MDHPINPTTKPKFTLEQTRKLRLMTMLDLSQKSGIAYGTIKSIEAGATPRFSTITKLSDALGVKPEEIIWPGDPIGLNDIPGLKDPNE